MWGSVSRARWEPGEPEEPAPRTTPRCPHPQWGGRLLLHCCLSESFQGTSLEPLKQAKHQTVSGLERRVELTRDSAGRAGSVPAALGDGVVDGLVHLLVVVVAVTGVLPHVRLQGRRVAAHVATQRAPAAGGNHVC